MTWSGEPILPFKVPRAIMLGGWLGSATQRHFAAMWVLMASGLIYVTHGFVSGRFGRNSAVQRFLYSIVILAGIMAVLTTNFFGEFDRARHFMAVCAILLFLVLHVVVALALPKSLRPMVCRR